MIARADLIADAIAREIRAGDLFDAVYANAGPRSRPEGLGNRRACWVMWARNDQASRSVETVTVDGRYTIWIATLGDPEGDATRDMIRLAEAVTATLDGAALIDPETGEPSVDWQLSLVLGTRNVALENPSYAACEMTFRTRWGIVNHARFLGSSL